MIEACRRSSLPPDRGNRIAALCGVSFALLAVVLATCSGCGSSDAIARPYVNASSAAKQAMQQLDSDGDGSLSELELAAAPYLNETAQRMGLSGPLTLNDLEARFKDYFDSEYVMTGVSCRVLLNGRPLDGAKIALEPPSFLSDSLEPASGATNSSGLARPVQPGKPGMYLGPYLVRITKLVDGQELIPARYNEQTELGIEVAQNAKTVVTDFELNLTAP